MRASLNLSACGRVCWFGGRAVSGGFLIELMVEAVHGQLQAVRNVELVVYPAQIILDDLLCGAELVGDLLVALGLREAGNDREFFGREEGPRPGTVSCTGLRTIGFYHGMDGPVIDPGFAGGDLAHAFYEQIGRDRSWN